MKMADKNALLLQGQREGLAKALEIVRQGGIEALEKECAYRGNWDFVKKGNYMIEVNTVNKTVLYENPNELIVKVLLIEF